LVSIAILNQPPSLCVSDHYSAVNNIVFRSNPTPATTFGI
jgi:hypothetical protein